MAATIGALLILAVIAIMFWAIKTMPERREPSITPLQDAYAPSVEGEDEDESATAT